ncbi:MAG: sigma 54-interacting transcriptional regulator [Treponema sp.]|nr:sigma 54-interacting transcriptional regulator [Treponema sp.]
MLSKISTKKFNKLIEINTLINSDYRDLNKLLSHIVESAMELCGGEAASLMLADEQRQALHFEVAVGVKAREVKKLTVRMNEGIAGWVAQNNKPLIVNDVANDKRHSRNISDKVEYPTKTMLAVPMLVRNECIGVVEVLNKSGGEDFTQEDLDWLLLFTGQAALAIVNAKTFERTANELQLLQDRTDTGAAFHTMISKSKAIADLLAIVDRVAKKDTSVLILGESGVGKELFAEQIHLRSSRSNAPFIRVNCAALPEGLLESELFGHVKGAFTSAISNRRGRFEMANGGTIFLDEIGDLPLNLQVKLLRVLQEKSFEKVGSDVTISVNTRIVAASNRNIEAMIAKGEFRNDLYYRLNVVPLEIPPLRHRTEDIPELAGYFLAKYSRANKKHFEGFSENALESMLTYSWPGNIRELENSIERACVMTSGKWIRREDLFLHTGIGGLNNTDRSLKTALNVFKANVIRKVLEENEWNQTETAKTLDIQRTYLSRLIKELNIKKNEE